MKHLLIFFAILTIAGCSSEFTENEKRELKTDTQPVVTDSTNSDGVINDSIGEWKPGKGGTVDFGEGKDI